MVGELYQPADVNAIPHLTRTDVVGRLQEQLDLCGHLQRKQIQRLFRPKLPGHIQTLQEILKLGLVHL